jgi:hypothetical protein
MRELEINVDHLRRLYQQDVVRVREENKKLKEILQAHGIQYDLGSPSSQSYTSPGSHSLVASPGSYSGQTNTSTNFNSVSPPSQPATMQIISSTTPSFTSQQSTSKSLQPPPINVHGLDYDELGLEFVAEYERTPYLSPPPNQ